MIFEGVDRALRLELQYRWEASDHGRMLYEVLPRVGREWQPLDIDRGAEERCDSSGLFPHRTLPLGWFFIAMGSVGEHALSIVCWGVLPGAFTMGVFSTECAERGVLEPRFGNKGNRFGLSCTLECRPLEPVLFAIRPTFQMGNLEGVFGGRVYL